MGCPSLSCPSLLLKCPRAGYISDTDISVSIKKKGCNMMALPILPDRATALSRPYSVHRIKHLYTKTKVGFI